MKPRAHRVAMRGKPRYRHAAELMAAVLIAGLLACSTDARADAPSEPVRVITHTRQHCEELSLRATALHQNAPAALEEARLLIAEGDRLCGQGQFRPGIIRLRRAIMLLRAQARPDATGR